MLQGKIKNLVEDRGFGFIETGEEKDIFFHASVCEGCEFDSLTQGQNINYELDAPSSKDKGPRASKVCAA